MDYKIVFTGPPGAGKTTAITALSDRAPVVTDVANHDADLAKLQTTVGLDYGEVLLTGGERVRLFGTPGQERFSFLWRILARQALGIVLLLDASRPSLKQDLKLYLSAFAPLLDTVPCVIGLGRCETLPPIQAAASAEGLVNSVADSVSDWVAEAGWMLPVLAVDVRRREDVLLLTDSLLALVEARESMLEASEESVANAASEQTGRVN